MKKTIWILALSLAILLSACSGTDNQTDPSGMPSGKASEDATPSADIPSAVSPGSSEGPVSHSTEEEPSSSENEPPVSPTIPGNGELPSDWGTEDVLKYWFHDALERIADASALQIVKDLEERGCFRMFLDMELTENYYPGFDYNMKMPKSVLETALLYNYSENERGFLYVLKLQDNTDDKVAETLKNSWMDRESYQMISVREENWLLLAMLQPQFDVRRVIEGAIAGKARDLVQIFLDYRKEHPDADALEIVEYLNGHQKFTECFTQQVSEGRLTGLGGKNAFDGTERLELHGFTDGAILSPMISPNTFICYVFFVKDASEMSGFEETLKNQADLAWNVCMVANTVITQTDGSAVLFIMCNE